MLDFCLVKVDSAPFSAGATPSNSDLKATLPSQSLLAYNGGKVFMHGRSSPGNYGGLVPRIYASYPTNTDRLSFCTAGVLSSAGRFFAVAGDSGAPVWLTDRSESGGLEEVVVGLVSAADSAGYITLITPITTILDESRRGGRNLLLFD